MGGLLCSLKNFLFIKIEFIIINYIKGGFHSLVAAGCIDSSRSSLLLVWCQTAFSLPKNCLT